MTLDGFSFVTGSIDIFEKRGRGVQVFSVVTSTAENELPATTTRRRVGYAVWIAGFIVLFAWTYLFGLHLGWSSADYLRGLLQGSDMAHGNILLNHWYSGDDSYWAIDSALFAIGVLVVGTKVVLAHVVAAFVWSSLIVVACVVATTGLRRRRSVAAIATIVVTLGLPCALFARFLSASDVHIATTLVALLAFIGLREGRMGWGWFGAVVLLAAGLLSDPLIIAYALVPAFVVGVLDSVRTRHWVHGLSTASAPVASLALAVVTRKAAEHFGTYRISIGTNLVPPSARIENVHALVPNVLSLLGFDGSFSANRIPWELAVFRFFGVLSIGAGFIVGLACLLLGVLNGQPRTNVQGMAMRSRSSYRLNDLLVLGVLGGDATFVAFRYDASGLRYLTTGIVFSTILGAMLIGHLVDLVKVDRVRSIGLALAVVILSTNAACAGIFLSRSAPISPYPRLSAFLVHHDLVRGIGDYWTSAPVTLYSNEKVTVRQVLPTFAGGIGPYLNGAKSTWYVGTFQFLVYDTRQFEGQLIQHAPRFPFAVVAHTYREGTFRIVVWKQPQKMANLERS
jgi:hypothetical protein